MSEYRLAEKPAMDVLAALGWQVLSPATALQMRQEEILLSTIFKFAGSKEPIW